MTVEVAVLQNANAIATAINELTDKIGGGSSVTVEPLTVTENKTYTAPEGKAYSPVTVDVAFGSANWWDRTHIVPDESIDGHEISEYSIASDENGVNIIATIGQFTVSSTGMMQYGLYLVLAGDLSSDYSFSAVKNNIDESVVKTTITPKVVEIAGGTYTTVEVPQFTEAEAEYESCMLIEYIG